MREQALKRKKKSVQPTSDVYHSLEVVQDAEVSCYCHNANLDPRALGTRLPQRASTQ